MRLRTLPVSVAGVIMAIAAAVCDGRFRLLPALLCLAFAVLAQIASNFANEYYDFKAGIDRAGRTGPRRGVTEGDITPRAMKAATYATLALASAIGCSLIHWGGWWLLAVGTAIAVGVLAYSAGPYPLSRHGLGEVAVVFFFGVIPVNFTFYLLTGEFTVPVAWLSLSTGLMGANVLIVNNYRDYDDDRVVGKHTLAVMMGRRFAAALYLVNGLAAAALIVVYLAQSVGVGIAGMAVIAIYLAAHIAIWARLVTLRGRRLNPLLGMTACNMLLTALLLLASA